MHRLSLANRINKNSVHYLIGVAVIVLLLRLTNGIVVIFCALIFYFFATGSEMTVMANKLGYDREVVRVWFCNKRQALKNASKRLKPDTSTTTTTLDNRTSPPLSLWFCRSNLIHFTYFGVAPLGWSRVAAPMQAKWTKLNLVIQCQQQHSTSPVGQVRYILLSKRYNDDVGVWLITEQQIYTELQWF